MKKDLTGQVFGYLTVLKQSESKYSLSYRAYTAWDCLCVCGKETKKISLHLRRKSPSCGCKFDHKSNPRLEPKEASFRGLYRKYKENAKSRNLIFDIDLTLFKELTQKNCHYCNSEPEKIYNVFITISGNPISSIEKTRNQGYIKYNGLDRLENSKGYLKDNIVPCCATCNQGKLTLGVNEFEIWLKKIGTKWCENHNDL